MAISHTGLELTSNPEDKQPFHKKQQLALAPNVGSDEDEAILIYKNRKKLGHDSDSKKAIIQDAVDKLLQEEIWEKRKRFSI